jgi:hypothetical protein
VARYDKHNNRKLYGGSTTKMSHLWGVNPYKKRGPLKIPSTEYRRKRIRQKGGFDDSWLDKKGLKSMEGIHRCHWCKEYMKPVMFNHKTGEMLMSCNTPGCIGNYETSEIKRQRLLEKAGARRVDAKLVTDFKQILFGRDPSRMGAIRDRIW